METADMISLIIGRARCNVKMAASNNLKVTFKRFTWEHSSLQTAAAAELAKRVNATRYAATLEEK